MCLMIDTNLSLFIISVFVVYIYKCWIFPQKETQYVMQYDKDNKTIDIPNKNFINNLIIIIS